MSDSGHWMGDKSEPCEVCKLHQPCFCYNRSEAEVALSEPNSCESTFGIHRCWLTKGHTGYHADQSETWPQEVAYDAPRRCNGFRSLTYPELACQEMVKERAGFIYNLDGTPHSCFEGKPGWQVMQEHQVTIDYTQLTELAKQIREQNQAKGFDFNHASLDQKLLLVVSEICEAQEALRDGYAPKVHWYEEDGKPEGFPVEVADAIIRLLDICGKYELDIGSIIKEKLAFNKSRPNKHGRTF